LTVPAVKSRLFRARLLLSAALNRPRIPGFVSVEAEKPRECIGY
jgi:hypothetical protein